MIKTSGRLASRPVVLKVWPWTISMGIIWELGKACPWAPYQMHGVRNCGGGGPAICALNKPSRRLRRSLQRENHWAVRWGMGGSRVRITCQGRITCVFDTRFPCLWLLVRKRYSFSFHSLCELSTGDDEKQSSQATGLLETQTI